MTRKHRFPTLVFALLSFIIIQIGSVSAASPSEDAIAGWFQSLKDAGATVAKYDALRVDEATDTIIVENPQIDWHIEFGIENAPAVDFKFTTPQIVIVGFRQETDGYSAKQYSFPEAAKITVSGKENKGDAFNLDMTVEGAKYEGVFYPRLTPAPEDPQHPVSRYLHYYDLYLKAVLKKSSAGKVSFKQTQNGEVGMQVEYEGISMQGLQNGQVEEIRVKSYKQTATLPSDLGGTPFIKMETNYGEFLEQGIDVRPLIEALKGEGKGPDSEYRVVTALASVANMEILAGPVNISMESYKASGLKVRPGKISLLALLDRLALGEKIDDKEGIATTLDFLRGFAVDEISVTNLKGSGPSNFTASMGKFIIQNLSNQGLDKFAIEAIDANGPDGEKIKMDHMMVGDIKFPAVKDIIAAIEAESSGTPQGPLEMAALSPKVGKIEVSNLFIDDKKKPAFSLGLFRILQSGFIGAIPTDIKIDTENFNLPVAYIQDPMAQVMLQSLGYDVLKIASKIALKWDETTQDLTLENADISLEDGLKFKLKAGVAGLPKSIIENPLHFSQALATLAFRNVNILVEDAVLVSGLLDHFAKMQNMPPEGLRTMITQAVESQAGPLAGTPFLEDVKKALGSFLENPQRLAVDVVPPAPVPFTQMLGTVSTAPDQLPVILGASVSAN